MPLPLPLLPPPLYVEEKVMRLGVLTEGGRGKLVKAADFYIRETVEKTKLRRQ